MGKSHEIVIKIRCYEWKKLELTPLSESCGLKLVHIEPRSTHQKRGLCWITNWQFYWSRSYVRLSLKISSQYESYTWGYTWRPLACYPFINIKLAAYHLLLYVVYVCQKSYNFVYALICYKQKCKVVSLNLAHPVGWNSCSSKVISLLVSLRCSLSADPNVTDLLQRGHPKFWSNFGGVWKKWHSA